MCVLYLWVSVCVACDRTKMLGYHALMCMPNPLVLSHNLPVWLCRFSSASRGLREQQHRKKATTPYSRNHNVMCRVNPTKYYLQPAVLTLFLFTVMCNVEIRHVYSKLKGMFTVLMHIVSKLNKVYSQNICAFSLYKSIKNIIKLIYQYSWYIFLCKSSNITL